jgi:DNA polymerase-3 subunit epsilon
MRQVVLDTETTGLSPQSGHRLTEIGCVEIINRKITGREYQTHLNPEREIDERASQITGLTWAMLKDKPKFSEVVADLIAFVGNDELIIHNAQFDLSFIENELLLIKHAWLKELRMISVVDTLSMSRQMSPGQRNSLDALCKRYNVDNTRRNLHGALLDAQILAEVYLAMTAGQTVMDLSAPVLTKQTSKNNIISDPLKIIYANEQELAAEAELLALIKKN